MADVVVVGGGIVGAATAAHLAAAGARVELFEAGPSVATGASGRNAGDQGVAQISDDVRAGRDRHRAVRVVVRQVQPAVVTVV